MNGRAILAWNLRKLRTERGLSQERLAADAGVDRAYLGGIERQVENPSVDALDKIASALLVDIGALLRHPDESDLPPGNLRRGRKPGSSSTG